METWVTIIPAPGKAGETARALLDLAISPNDVRTANAGNEFVVAPYIAEQFNAPPAPKRRRAKKEEGEE